MASSIVAIPMIIALVWLGGPLFTSAVAVAAALAAYEATMLLEPGAEKVQVSVSVVGAILLVLGAAGGSAGILAALACVLVADLIAFTIQSGQSQTVSSPGLLRVAAVVYAGLPAALLVLERSWSGPADFVPFNGLVFDFGATWVLLTLTSVWAVDTLAYAAGRVFGRHLLWPAISPKKTWEGTVAGVLVGTLVASAWAPTVGRSTAVGIALGICVAIAAVVGDLAESALKRRAGVKDAGQLIPGHGGILDRIDGLVFSVIVVFLFGTLVGLA
ncbi:MAG TPA: phosphatidate cytidylyltransferase [Chloroflexota bacterium]|nr:phosphatidate cytidylyltransferase [Chloroflexota bacterium]